MIKQFIQAVENQDWTRAEEVLNQLRQLEKKRDWLEEGSTTHDVSRVLDRYGSHLIKSKKFEKALECLKISLSFIPDNVIAWNHIGWLFQEMGRFEEAMRYHRRAMVYRADYSHTWSCLGRCYFRLCRYQESFECYREALRVNPKDMMARYNLGLLLLLTGDLLNGFTAFSIRFFMEEVGKHSPEFRAKLWRGEDLNKKKVLIATEQGYGDTIQFMRFIEPLRKKYDFECHMACPKESESFLKPNLKVDKWIDEVEYSAELMSDYDCVVPLLVIPVVLKTTLKTIPADLPYIKVDEKRQKLWSKKIKNKRRKKIGLCLSGSRNRGQNDTRSLEINDMGALIKSHDKFDFCQLALNEKPSKIIVGLENFIDLSEDLENFMDTAAVIMEMDIVISVCTAVAHLAGALGKPVWILVHDSPPDWRWMLNTDKTPWYPKATLIRHKALGDKKLVVDDLKVRLETLFKTREQPKRTAAKTAKPKSARRSSTSVKKTEQKKGARK